MLMFLKLLSFLLYQCLYHHKLQLASYVQEFQQPIDHAAAEFRCLVEKFQNIAQRIPIAQFWNRMLEIQTLREFFAFRFRKQAVIQSGHLGMFQNLFRKLPQARALKVLLESAKDVAVKPDRLALLPQIPRKNPLFVILITSFQKITAAILFPSQGRLLLIIE